MLTARKSLGVIAVALLVAVIALVAVAIATSPGDDPESSSEPPPDGPSLSAQDRAYGEDLIAAGILEDLWATEKMAYEARRVCELLDRTPPPAGLTLEYHMTDAEQAATFARISVQHYCPANSERLEALITSGRVVTDI